MRCLRAVRAVCQAALLSGVHDWGLLRKQLYVNAFIVLKANANHTTDRTATPSYHANLSTRITILWSGTTLTSGYAYLSYAGVTAMATGKGCGNPKPAGILPLILRGIQLPRSSSRHADRGRPPVALQLC